MIPSSKFNLSQTPIRWWQGGHRFLGWGATIVLISHEFAKELGLRGKEVRQLVQVCSKKYEEWETIAYWVVMVEKLADHNKMKALGINKITSDIQHIEINGMSNSSLNNNRYNHSYNSTLAKGSNSIQPLLQIIIKFRS